VSVISTEQLSDGRTIRVARAHPERPVARLDGRNHPKLEGISAEADVALEVWARWAKRVLGGLGWPAWTLVARVIEFGVSGAASRNGLSSHLEADQLCEMVEKIIMKLKEIDRSVLVIQYLRWQPIEVSAQQCSMSPGRFRTVLHRARRDVGHRLDGIKIALQQNTP
jgi:hypothetical protein